MALRASLSLLTSLQSINIGSNDIGREGAVALSASLSLLTSLQFFDICSNDIGAEGAVALSTSLSLLTSLQSVNISSNNIGNEGAVALSASLSHLTSLQSLNISNNFIGAEGAVALSASLTHLTSLQSLNVGGNSINTEGAVALSASMSHLLFLQALDISNNYIGAEGAFALSASLSLLTGLHSVDVRGNEIGAEGAVALVTSLCLLTTLQSIDVSSDDVGAEGAEVLSASLVYLTALQSLSVSNNYIGYEGALALSTSLSHLTSLQSLNVSNNYIGYEGALALSASLVRLTALQSLNVSCNLVGDMGVVDLSVSFFHLTSLQSLDVSYNDIGAEGAEVLSVSLVHLTALQSLNVSCNLVGDKGALALSASLVHLTALQSLNVSCNDIGAAGALALGACLCQMTALQSLDIWKNAIGTGGVICILDSISTTIESLKVSICGLEGHLVTDMSRLTRLREIDLSGNNLTSLDLSLFLLPCLDQCSLNSNPNLKQPPLFEVAHGLGRLREYARCEKAQFNKLMLAIVGKEGVGKTVLTYRLMGRDDEAEQYLSFDRDGEGMGSTEGETRGVHHEEWVISSTKEYTTHYAGRLELMVWDYAGQSGYRGLHQCFFSRQGMYVLVFDLTRDAEESARELCSWVRSIHSCVSGPVICVVGTKLDKVSRNKSEARAKYLTVLRRLHEYRRQWREALEKHLKRSLGYIFRESTRLDWNELLHRDVCLPDVPLKVSDVDPWLVDCKNDIASVSPLRRALVDLIEQRAQCGSYFPHLHQPREKWWRDVDRAIESIKGENDLCPPLCVAVTAIVDKVRSSGYAVESGGADSGEELEEVDLVGCVERALMLTHDCGMRLWYRHHPLLAQYVFHDPRIVTELLRVLMEPLHLARESDPTLMLTQLSSSVVNDLMCGRVHISAIDVLWKDFGDRHGLEGITLRRIVISVLEQLNLLTRDRDAVDVYLCMYLMRRYDFVRDRELFVRNERIAPATAPWESPWFALDIVFEAGSMIEGPGGVLMAAGIPPADLAEKFLLRLYDQQSVWWTSVSLANETDHPSHRRTMLQLYGNCLTDGELCEVSSVRTVRGDEVYRVLLWDPTHSRAPLMAKLALDIFQEVLHAQYPSVFFKTRVVLGPSVMFNLEESAADSMSSVSTPILPHETDSWQFWLTTIKLTEDGFADPNQTTRRHGDNMLATSRGCMSASDGMISPCSSHRGPIQTIHVSRVWPTTSSRSLEPTSSVTASRLSGDANWLASSEVVRESPQTLLSRVFSYQGIRMDPANVEVTAEAIAAYMESVGVMRDQVGATYSCFISYRVSSDAQIAESLYDKLRLRGYNPFLDKFCLLPSQPWEPAFRRAIPRSRVFIPLISAAALAPAMDRTRDHSKDNLLLEYQIALSVLDADEGGDGSFHIYPVLIGRRDGSTLYDFAAFTGYSDTLRGLPPAPEVPSSCSIQ